MRASHSSGPQSRFTCVNAPGALTVKTNPSGSRLCQLAKAESEGQR